MNTNYKHFLEQLKGLMLSNPEAVEIMRQDSSIRLYEYEIYNELKRLELEDLFGLQLMNRAKTCYNIKGFGHLEYHIGLFHYDGEYRTINNISPTPQPKDEWLLNISFPTGAYFLIDDNIFNKSYLKELFDQMLEEFLAFNPKYVDRLNKSIYFTQETAKEVLDNWNSIVGKYKGMVSNELKKIKIAKLQAELSELEGDEDV